MSPADEFSPKLWSFVALTKGDESKIRNALSELSKEEFVELIREFERAKTKLWLAFDDESRLFGTGISDDGKHDIFANVVSLGKEHYNHVFHHPEDLKTDIEPNESPMVFVPGPLFWELFEEELNALL